MVCYAHIYMHRPLFTSSSTRCHVLYHRYPLSKMILQLHVHSLQICLPKLLIGETIYILYLQCEVTSIDWSSVCYVITTGLAQKLSCVCKYLHGFCIWALIKCSICFSVSQASNWLLHTMQRCWTISTWANVSQIRKTTPNKQNNGILCGEKPIWPALNAWSVWYASPQCWGGLNWNLLDANLCVFMKHNKPLISQTFLTNESRIACSSTELITRHTQLFLSHLQYSSNCKPNANQQIAVPLHVVCNYYSIL